VTTMSKKRRRTEQTVQTTIERVESAIEQIEQIESTISKELEAEELLPLAPYDESKLTDEQKKFIRDAQSPASYVIPEHSGCAAFRPDGYRYGVVVHTQTINEPDRVIITRYCHCRFCRPWSSLDSRIEYRYKDVQTIKK
jgi:hypothetical protein